MAEKMNPIQRLMKWASEIHLARVNVEKLHAERLALECARESGALPLPPGKQPHPCWKWVADCRTDREGDSVADNWANGGGRSWCLTCIERQRVHALYRHAVARLGSLKGALWRLAAKAHAEVEAELDDAGKPDARVRVVRLQLFRADCGHKFKTDDQAVSHMTRCWKSPQTRTCKTCKHGHHAQYEEETGYGGEWECRNPEMLEEDFTPAHEKAPDICIRCPKWESKR